MKHVQLFEDFLVTEKVYQLTGQFGAKGIPGKVLFAFKKEIERVKYEGDPKTTLADINKVWSNWADTAGTKIIEQEVLKQVRDKESIVYLVASLGGYEWIADDANRVNSPTRSELLVRFPMDFTINVGFMDDVDGSKFARKLGGMMNTALTTNIDTAIIGKYDSLVEDNNVEIRASLFLTVDAK